MARRFWTILKVAKGGMDASECRAPQARLCRRPGWQFTIHCNGPIADGARDGRTDRHSDRSNWCPSGVCHGHDDQCRHWPRCCLRPQEWTVRIDLDCRRATTVCRSSIPVTRSWKSLPQRSEGHGGSSRIVRLRRTRKPKAIQPPSRLRNRHRALPTTHRSHRWRILESLRLRPRAMPKPRRSLTGGRTCSRSINGSV